MVPCDQFAFAKFETEKAKQRHTAVKRDMRELDQRAFANGRQPVALDKVEVRHGRMTQVITGIGKPRSKPARHDKHDGPVIAVWFNYRT